MQQIIMEAVYEELKGRGIFEIPEDVDEFAGFLKKKWNEYERERSEERS